MPYEPCADTSKAWHVQMKRDSDGYQTFYSGHDTKEIADGMACQMNARAANPDDASVPHGFTYTTIAKPPKK